MILKAGDKVKIFEYKRFKKAGHDGFSAFDYVTHRCFVENAYFQAFGVDATWTHEGAASYSAAIVLTESGKLELVPMNLIEVEVTE